MQRVGLRHMGGAEADSACDSSSRRTGSYRGGQQKTVAHGFEYGHGPRKTLTDDCPADGIQKVRGSNPLGSTRLAFSESLADRIVFREARGNPVGATWERRGNLGGIA